MSRRYAASACLLGLALLAPLSAQEKVEIRNWSAPPFWTPPKVAKPDDSASSAEPMAVEGGFSAMPFIATVPCRVVDTRNAPGPYGGPAIAGGAAARTFAIPGGPCPIPVGAGAYSINVAAILPAADGFLTVFPTGFSQPNSSDLNFLGGEVIANALIVPAGGASFAINVFANVTTHLIIDINGYYLPGGLDPTYVNEGQVSSVSSAMIADGAIVNADISASAAIADTKLATIVTGNKVADSALSANVSKLGSSIDTAEISNDAVTAAKIPNLTRSVAIPLPGFADCGTGVVGFLDFISSADAKADYVTFGSVGSRISLLFDSTAGSPDQDSPICAGFSVPLDYASGGEIRLNATLTTAPDPATEVLNCSAGRNFSAHGASGTVSIPANGNAFYTCTPTLTGLAAGEYVDFFLMITSNGTMDDAVRINSLEFRYVATH